MGADVVVVSTGIVLVVKGTYSAVVTDALVETIVVSEPVVVAVVDTDILVEAVVGAMVASEVGRGGHGHLRDCGGSYDDPRACGVFRDCGEELWWAQTFPWGSWWSQRLW